jgi:hypothetical protein
MNTRRLLVVFCLISLLGSLTFHGAAQTESDDDSTFIMAMLGVPIEKTLVFLSQPKPGHLMTTEDYIKTADWCSENCHRYTLICASGDIYSEYGVATRIREGDLKYYLRQRDEACRCAKDNYNMALEVCPINDLKTQAMIFADIASVELSLGNLAAVDANRQTSQLLLNASEAGEEIPLSPWITVMSILAVVMLLGRKGNRGRQS